MYPYVTRNLYTSCKQAILQRSPILFKMGDRGVGETWKNILSSGICEMEKEALLFLALLVTRWNPITELGTQ